MSEEITASVEDLHDLEIARGLVRAGVAVFAAPPDPSKPGTYRLPPKWQDTVPSEALLDRWQPGWALGMVGGRVVDGLDEDPRSGGDASIGELHAAGHMPMTFGEQSTASGGRHWLIAATGERKATGFMPGLDLQAGEPSTGKGGGEKLGRGFIWIAPTVRPSKDPSNFGELTRYRWTTEPDMELLDEMGETARESTEGIVSRVHAARARGKAPKPRESAPGAASAHDLDDPFMDSSMSALFADARQNFGPGRPFTLAEAQAFLLPSLTALGEAKIGDIEARCNDAAVALSHFVPAFWSVESAMTLLRNELARTAYDPNGPSDWTVEKFEDVLDGTRPPDDPWTATFKEPAPEPPSVSVEAPPGQEGLSTAERLRRMLVSAADLSLLDPPEPLVHGLLNLETESWLIGEPGSMKSFVALDIAGHVARGAPWQGHRVEQRPVLYIAAEGQRGMVLRVRAWMKQHGDMEGVTFLPYPVQVQSSDGQWAALVEIAEELKPGLIVLDTQARITVGLKENDADQMGIMIAAVGRLKRATGACVLVVHHTGRDGGNARGSSAIDGAQDSELKIERNKPRSSLVCTLKQDKQKDMAEGDGRGLALVMKVVPLGQDRYGEPLTSLVVDPDVDAVDRILRDAEGFTVEEMEPWAGKDSEEWTKHVDGVDPRAKVKRYILQVLADHAHSLGLTEAKARSAVVARWYPDAGRRGGTKLDMSNWVDAWGAVVSTDLAENIGGERWALDQALLGQLKTAYPS